MEMVAHRGLWSAYATENSARAIESAIHRGISRIEVDVRQDADGTMYLLHDAFLGRVCRTRGKLRDMPTSRSRAVTLRDGTRLVRLEDALDIAANRATLCLDVKEADSALAVLRLVRERKLDVEIWTAHSEIVAAAVHCGLRSVLISLGWHPDGVGQFLWKAGGAGAAAVSFFPADLEPFVARLCHNAGMPVQCGTPNDLATWRTLDRLGVHTIVTDRPLQCAAALNGVSAHHA